jgi:filamentous hemagglutinin family protein
VVQGSAGISQSGNTTNINQSSNKAIINWQGFSIAPQETVNFNQPSSSAVTLNRVIGNEQSVISGALNANGQVFIVNSAGIVFTKGSQVNVGGLVASTLDISNADFKAGNYVFSGSSTASVVNQGAINAHDGGYVALLGKTVSNEGAISATLGTVAMASGQKVTLNFAGDSLIDVTIDDGVLNALVENKAAIKADGGRVILTAKAADAVLSAQVNNSGIIQARTMAALTGGGVARTGSIKLHTEGPTIRNPGGTTLFPGGTIHVAGTLDASAPGGGKGGTIETSGNKVTIAGDAAITTKAASGENGTWTIAQNNFTIGSGGDMTGAQLGSRLADGNVTVQSVADIYNRAGNIYVNDAVTWSSGNTLTLDANSAIYINAPFTGSSSASGLTLQAQIVNINTPSAFVVNTLNVTRAAVYINAPQNWTTNGSWTFTAADIDVYQPVNWSGSTPLLLSSGRNLNIEAPISGSGAVTLQAVSNINVDTASAFAVNTLNATAGGAINIDAPQNWAASGSWIFTGGEVNVDGAVKWSGNTPLTLDSANAININAPITGSGALALNAGTDININMPSAFAIDTITATAGNNVNINGSQNWTAPGSWTFTGANINVDAAVNWSAGALAFNASNNINVNSPVNWSSGSLTLGAGANIFVNKVMTATGTGSLIASYGSGVNADGSPNGLYMSLANPGTYAGRIDFSGTGNVTLEGQNYTVINSVAELDAVGSNPSSNYVLGSSLANLTFGDVLPFGFSSLDQFTGNFNGFGHSLTLSPLAAISITSPLSIAALKDTNLVLTSSGDININAPVTSGAGLLTFNAVNNINLNASVSDLGDNTGSFAFVAGNNIPVGQSPSVTGADIFIDGPVSWSAGALTLNAASNIYVNGAMTATDTASFDANYGSGTNLDGSPMGLNMAFGTDANGVGNGTFVGKLDFSGSGTLTINNNAYTLITSWDQLTAISGVAGYFALASNLTAPSTALSGAAIAELGQTQRIHFHNVVTPATLDGLGHTISNLTINDAGGNGHDALINTVDAGGAVRNIGIVNVNITSGAPISDAYDNGWNAGLIGTNNGAVTNDFATGSITGVGAIVIGGLVGQNIDGAISNSYAEVTINSPGGWDLGGLVGDNSGAVISGSYATGNVSGGSGGNVGGLVGINMNNGESYIGAIVWSNIGTITDSYATGNVTVDSAPPVGYGNNVGGLVGMNYYGNVSYSHATGNVKGGGEVGGLIGRTETDSTAYGNVTNSYATGNVSTDDNTGSVVGGLVGSGGTILYSYATGNVSGGNTVGGLAGSGSNISYSYATGNVLADGAPPQLPFFDAVTYFRTGPTAGAGGLAGGLVGSGGTVNYSYATGNVTATGDGVGGLVGSGGSITNSYYAPVVVAGVPNVVGRDMVGGLTGVGLYTTNSYATGNVSGLDAVGGAVGYAGSSFTNGVVAYGNVSGRNAVGGLIGYAIGGIDGPLNVTNSAAHGNVTSSGLYGGALIGYISGFAYEDAYVNVTHTTGSGSVTRDGRLCQPSASDSCNFGYVSPSNIGNTSGNTYIPPVITPPNTSVATNQQTDAQTAAAQTAAAGARAATVAATTGTAMAAAGAPSAAQSTAGTTAVASIGGPQIDDNIRIETPAPPPAAKAETPTNRAPSEEQLQRRRVAATTTARKAHAGSGGANFGATIRSIEIDGQRFDLQGGGAKPDAAKDGASGAHAQ